jgi:hypothetical protein
MEILNYVALCLILAIFLLLYLDRKKYSRLDNANFGSYVSGIATFGSLILLFFFQLAQTHHLQNQKKISDSNVLKLAPYIALSFEYEKFAYYESYEEMVDKNEDKIKARKESNDKINLYQKIKHNKKNKPTENSLEKNEKNEKKPLTYYGIENGVAHINTLIYNEGSSIYNATIVYKPDHHRNIETKYIKKIGKEPIEFKITIPVFYFLSNEKNKVTIEIIGTDINAQPINKKISIYLRNEIKNKLKKMKVPDHMMGEIAYARRVYEFLTYKVEDIKK